MYHYKELNPSQTIENIQNFFSNKKLLIKILYFEKTTIDTYWCRCALKLNNIIILKSNGKGITKDLALASCYAELYERFCFFCYVLPNNPYTYSNIINNQLLKQDKITLKDLISDEHILEFLKFQLPEISNFYLQKYIDIKFNKQLYGIKFEELNNKQNISYKNIQLLSYVTGSNGVAAGNTIEEALVQGISELCEREIVTLFYENKINIFYRLNLTKLNTFFQNIIKILEKNNIDIQIYDLSYTLNTPVIMIVAFHKIKKIFYYSFGSHPIFNIALERCFTELYQGFLDFDEENQYLIQYRPNKNNLNVIATALRQSKSKNGFINETLIMSTNEKETYNNQIFLNDSLNISNIKLLEYFKNLLEKNKTVLQWADISLTQNIKTIYIVQKKLTQKTFLNLYPNIQLLSKTDQKQLFDILILFTTYYKYLIIDHIQISTEQLLQYINILYSLIKQLHLKTNEEKIKLFLNFIGINYYSLFTFSPKTQIDQAPFFMLLDIFFNGECQLNNNYNNIIEKQLYDVYKLIESYYIQKYPKEKIKKILNWLHYEDIELDFELKDMTPLWYINKIFIKPLYDKYHSQEYYDFINIFGPDKTITEINNKEILEDSN